jgi:O-methyltransferase
MMNIQPIKSLAKSCISMMGYQLVPRSNSNSVDLQSFPTELSKEDKSIFDYVFENGLSMSNRERLYSTLLACRHVVEANVPGGFVECGVWRGGMSILAADVFRRLDSQRPIYLYDTFAGMTAPTAIDINLDGMSATERFQATARETHTEWAFCPFEEVQANFSRRGLLNENVHFVRGDVLETLRQPKNLPAIIFSLATGY